MPKIRKLNGKYSEKVIIEKVWFEIEFKTDKSPSDIRSYLVHPDVADYMELLESKLDTIPTL